MSSSTCRSSALAPVKVKADGQAVQGAQQVQPQPPEVPRVAGAVAVLGPTGQVRAEHCVPGAAAFDRGGVDHPHIVMPQAGIGGQDPGITAKVTSSASEICGQMPIAGRQGPGGESVLLASARSTVEYQDSTTASSKAEPGLAHGPGDAGSLAGGAEGPGAVFAALAGVHDHPRCLPATHGDGHGQRA
jgi:hypothetical protein